MSGMRTFCKGQCDLQVHINHKLEEVTVNRAFIETGNTPLGTSKTINGMGTIWDEEGEDDRQNVAKEV